jgi:hypothetical protein
MDATGAEAYEYLVTGLSPGVEYGLGVSCSDGFNESRRPVIWVTPVDSSPPGPPQNLVVCDHPNDDGGVLDVTFDASADDGAGADDVQE